MTDLKPAAGGDKRHSRRPVWRSLKVATNVGCPNDSHNNHTAASASGNEKKDHSGTGVDQTKSRLSHWLSQQVYEHERQAHYSPSRIDEREASTMSNLSLVSHVSSVSSATSDVRKRPSSVPTSPASPTIPRLLMTPVLPTNLTTNISSPSPPPPHQPRLLAVMTAKMVPPSSRTTSTLSGTSSIAPPPPSTATPMTNTEDPTQPLPLYSPPPTAETADHHEEEDDTDSGDDENDDTYKTAGGSSDYSEDMDDRLDEINDYSDDSIYYINRYYDDHSNNNINDRKLDDTHSTKTTTTTDDFIDECNDVDDDDTSGRDAHRRNEDGSYSTNNSNNDTDDAKVMSVFDKMDPEVAQALLEWRRQSLLKIDWFDMFATKSDLWRTTTLFHTFISSEHQDPSSSSNPSSIANSSLDSLQFKDVPLDIAFRSYSKKIDYAKARVSDIDQALQVFSQLYWECNPSKLFQCAELVYIIIHSLMLLNTDVHAGQEHTTMDGFCDSTIKLVLAHQASIPIMLFDADGESTWQQSMTECLQSLYRSVKRSSLLGSNQLHPGPLAITTEHSSTSIDSQDQDENEGSMIGLQFDTAFNDLFISPADSKPAVTPKKSISTPQKKQPPRHQRSNSLLSTPSWTLLRRKDTHRTKIGPYKEGPLSCQLNGEPWKICWVILHFGHLHIYHHRLGETSTTTTTTPISEKHHATTTITTTTTGNSISSSSSTNPRPSEANKSKVKKKFMQHLAPSTTVTNSATNLNRGQMVRKKEPYQEVDIHLGNTFCERYGPHVFLLQLANGNNTYMFDCGSESQTAVWIRDCNYWAARETKIVLSRLLSSSSAIMPWRRPPPPAGASVLDKKGQQKAIDAHLLYLQTEHKHHLQQPGWASGTWQDKKTYLELEIRKYQCYQDSIYQ